MAKDLKFTSEDLLNIKFKAVDRGYDPYQVDAILDQIIEDYKKIETGVSENNDKLIAQIQELRKQNQNLATQLEKEKNRIKYLPKDQKEVSLDNYELLQRIGKLESIIFERLDLNPDDIK